MYIPAAASNVGPLAAAEVHNFPFCRRKLEILGAAVIGRLGGRDNHFKYVVRIGGHIGFMQSGMSEMVNVFM
jgi:hypothetical protein